MPLPVSVADSLVSGISGLSERSSFWLRLMICFANDMVWKLRWPDVALSK